MGAKLARSAMLAAALLSAASVHSQRSTPTGNKQRYAELARTVDRNVGHAHMVRGVNICTIAALRRQVTAADIPILQDMLAAKDTVHRLAAGYVLSILGAPGAEALRKSGRPLGPGEAEDFIARAAETEQAVALSLTNGSCRI